MWNWGDIMAGPVTSHEFIRYIDIEERVSAAAYTGDAGADYIMAEDGVIHKIIQEIGLCG